MTRGKIKTITLTMNPSLDKSTSTRMVVPERKICCKSPEFAPGGGGINVSRALKRLGCESVAFFLAGGENGRKIEHLLKDEEVDFISVNSGVNTRENILVTDENLKCFYRFIMPGSEVKEDSWKKILKEVKDFLPKPNYLIASGSLPPGVPEDFYAQLASFAKKNDVRMILDTKGVPLKLALTEGVHLVKINLHELSEIFDKEDNLTGIELEKVAQNVLSKGYSNNLVVSLGEKGAMLVLQDDIIEYLIPPTMPVKSIIGVGDSMVAGIVAGCTKGFWPEQAVRYGVAAGTAAAMTPLNELCRKEDTDEIFEWMTLKNGKE